MSSSRGKKDLRPRSLLISGVSASMSPESTRVFVEKQLQSVQCLESAPKLVSCDFIPDIGTFLEFTTSEGCIAACGIFVLSNLF